MLLILAGVSIATLTGQNGILTQAQNASEKTLTANEMEEIGVAYNGAKANNLGEVVTDSDLNEQFNLNNIRAEAQGKGKIAVKFLDSDNEYLILEDGSITEINVEQVKDSNPGEFNGEGTETNPYLIESIEDLVALATNVNGGEEYIEKNFKLMQDLNFNSDKSYADKDTKYIYNSTKDGYEKNSEGESIKQLCTTGEGFISIGRKEVYFCGNFEGNNHTIHNLYINIDEEANIGQVGLFGGINMDSEIRNLSVNGQISVRDVNINYVGGMVGVAQCGTGRAKIINCNSDVDFIICNVETSIGGIVGWAYGTIENCNNYGNIILEEGGRFVNIGGIAGGIGSSEIDEVINCNNYGNIQVNVKGDTSIGGAVVGGIAGYNNGAIIENCVNEANLEFLTTSGICVVGGITAYNDSWSNSSGTTIATIKNSTNKGSVKGVSEQNDCYVGGISGYSKSLSVIESSTNEGILEARAENGTVYRNDIVAKVE